MKKSLLTSFLLVSIGFAGFAQTGKTKTTDKKPASNTAQHANMYGARVRQQKSSGQATSSAPLNASGAKQNAETLETVQAEQERSKKFEKAKD